MILWSTIKIFNTVGISSKSCNISCSIPIMANGSQIFCNHFDFNYPHSRHPTSIVNFGTNRKKKFFLWQEPQSTNNSPFITISMTEDIISKFQAPIYFRWRCKNSKFIDIFWSRPEIWNKPWPEYGSGQCRRSSSVAFFPSLIILKHLPPVCSEKNGVVEQNGHHVFTHWEMQLFQKNITNKKSAPQLNHVFAVNELSAVRRNAFCSVISFDANFAWCGRGVKAIFFKNQPFGSKFRNPYSAPFLLNANWILRWKEACAMLEPKHKIPHGRNCAWHEPKKWHVDPHGGMFVLSSEYRQR